MDISQGDQAVVKSFPKIERRPHIRRRQRMLQNIPKRVRVRRMVKGKD